jgi:hypothetical protein
VHGKFLPQMPERWPKQLRYRHGEYISYTYLVRNTGGCDVGRLYPVEVPVNLNSKVGAKKVISRFQESFGNKCAVLQDQIDRKRAPFHFVSLHEGVDTSTPNGRPVFGIFASIAEFERELIRDRVKSGLALAKSRGKCLGRPRVNVDRLRIATLRNDGRSWAEICDVLGISKGTAQRAVLSLPKNLLEPVPASS